MTRRLAVKTGGDLTTPGGWLPTFEVAISNLNARPQHRGLSRFDEALIDEDICIVQRDARRAHGPFAQASQHLSGDWILKYDCPAILGREQLCQCRDDGVGVIGARLVADPGMVA